VSFKLESIIRSFDNFFVTDAISSYAQHRVQEEVDKWYFCGFDGSNSEWQKERKLALTFSSKESAADQTLLLQCDKFSFRLSKATKVHAKLRVEESSSGDFVLCFDTTPLQLISEAEKAS
jgi:hypothetical protein